MRPLKDSTSWMQFRVIPTHSPPRAPPNAGFPVGSLQSNPTCAEQVTFEHRPTPNRRVDLHQKTSWAGPSRRSSRGGHGPGLRISPRPRHKKKTRATGKEPGGRAGNRGASCFLLSWCDREGRVRVLRLNWFGGVSEGNHGDGGWSHCLIPSKLCLWDFIGLLQFTHTWA